MMLAAGQMVFGFLCPCWRSELPPKQSATLSLARDGPYIVSVPGHRRIGDRIRSLLLARAHMDVTKTMLIAWSLPWWQSYSA